MSGFLIFVVLALRLVTGAEGLFGMLPKERDCHWAIYDGTDQQQQCVQRLMDHDALEGAVEFFQDEDFRRVLKIAEFNPLGIPKLSVLDAIRWGPAETIAGTWAQVLESIYIIAKALGFIPKIGPFFKQIANLIDEPLEKLDEKVKKLDEKCEDLDKWAGRLNKGLEYLQAASTFAWAVNIIILPPLVNHLCDDTNAQVTALLETRCSLEELEDLGQPIESLCSVGEVVGDGSSLINSLDGLESFVGEVRDIIDGPVKELQDKEPALNSLKDSIGATSIALTRFIEPFDPVRGLMDSLYEVTKFLDCGDFCIVFDAINIAIDAVLEAFGLKDEVEALFGELLDDLNVPDLDVLNLDVLDFNFGSRLDQIVAGPEVPGTLQRAQFDFLDEISGSFQCTWEAAPGAWLTKIASSLNDETISFSCPAGARPIVYRAEYNVWDCTQELTALMRFPCAENENSCTFDFENLTQCANAEAPDPKLAELVLNPSMLRAQYFCIPFGQTPTILSSYIGLDVTRVAETAFVEVESSPAPVFWVEEKRHDFKHRDIDIMRSPTCAGNRFLKLVDRSDINSCWSAENVAGLPAPFIPSLDLPNRLDAWETERLCYSMWRARREAGQSIYTAVELGTWNFLQQRGATLAILGSAPPAGDICGEYSADASGLRVYCFPELCGVTETESDRAFQPPNDWWSLCEHYGADPIVSSAVLARGAFKSNREAELDRWTEQNRERTESNVCINKFADCESATSATCDLAGCEPDFIGYACLNPVSSAPNGVVTYTFADSEIEVGGGGVRSQICAGDESLSVISAEFGNGFDVLDVTERVQRDQCKSGSCVISARRMAMSLKVDPEENNTLRLDAVCICRAGYELLRVDGDCVLCPTGYTRSNDQDACVAAPRGFYVPSGPLSTPIACSRGTFAEEAASTSCAPCPIGTYSNSLGADSADACLPCPEGTVATRTGEDLCAECPIGTQPNDARTGCDPCPVGTFGVSRGDGYCQDAHPGFFVPEFKFTGQERPCTVGFYNNESGQSKCKAAPLGYYVEEPAWDRLPKKCDEGLTTLRIASTSRFDCISPAECPRPEVGEDCGQFMDRIGVPRSETANGFCQSCLNVEICDYDGGDCCVDTCERTILLDSDLPSLENEFFVRSCDPTKMKCIAPRTGTVACQFSEKFEGLPPGFENTECDNSSPRKGNGICDADLNYPNCQYDGGDCCLSTCDKGSGDPSACLLYDDRRVCRNPDAGLVLDEEPPELIGIPADVVLECGRNFPRADVYALDNDPCYAGRVESSLSFEVPPIDNCIQRNRSRTWVAKDPSGNVSERTQLVAILADETAPQFEDPRPGDVVVDPGVDLSPENTGGSPVATDDCTSVTVSYSDEVVDESCNGMRIIRTWTATDECGNFDSYEQNITQLVLDETPPVLLDVPESFDTVCDSEFVPTPMDESGVTARDNDMCFNNEVQMSNVESGNACEGRLFTRTWSAVDPSGNTSEMTQVITVLGDQGAPEFEQPTPPDFVVPHGADMSPDNTGGSATATDDCSRDVRISYSDEIPDGFCNGERDITRTWTATDECDNSSSVEQLITQIVFDETPPTLLNVPASFDAICERDFTPTPMDDFDVTAVDDDECFNGEVQTSSVEGGNTCDGRVFTRTWSATDPSGQKVAETQTITLLRDTFKPEFTNFPNDEIFSCTAAEDDLATARTGFPGATDSCSTVGNVEYEDDSSLPDGRCFGEVVITRTFRVTDGCSNTATAPQRLTIKGDVTPPEFLRFPDDVTVTYLEDRISPEVTGWPMVTDDCSPDVMIQYEDEYSVPDDRCSGEKLITRTWTASDRCGNSATAVQKQMIRVRTVGAMFDDSLYMSTSSLKHLSMASNAFIEGGIKARKNAGINGMIGGSESSCPLPQAVVAGYKVTIQEAEAADATADARRIIHYGKSLKLKTKNGLVVNSAMSYDVEDYERLVAQTVDLSDRLFNDESLLKLDDGPRRRFCKVGLDGCGITGTVSMSTKGLVVVEDDTVKLLARHSIYNIFHLDDLEQLFTVNGKGGVRRVEFECDPTASIVLNVPGRTSTVRLQPLVYDLQACNPGQILVNIHDQERDVTVKNTPGNLYPFSLLIPKARVTLNNVVVTGQLVAKDTRLSNKAKILCPLFEGSYSCADLT